MGARAARANLGPGLALLAFAAALLIGYYTVSPVTAALDAIGTLKTRFGLGFAVVSTCLFGAVLPALIQRALGRPAHPRLTHFLVVAAFWSVVGVEVDLLYRLQSLVFGDGRDPLTLTLKVFVDMGIWVPLWAAPTTVALYQWNDLRHRVPGAVPFRASGTLRRWYAGRVVPMVISNNAVWTPSVFIIYALPPALQLIVMNLILCFWSLIVALQTRDGAGEAPA